ncbi:prolyl-tRNA synthetase associated domain-containing protein [Candidatus Uhrbacteria bacterium]|nr:prolyl-tRNA synthetase associated domain-containing protein [Candidatus Uhrbacteria bacterium]
MEEALAFLNAHNISFERFDHPAVFTCEEAEVHCKHVPGMACKNLFLKDKGTGRFFLVTLPADKRMDLKVLGKHLGTNKLTFGSADELRARLGLEPGSVSPLGLLNDHEHSVRYLVGRDVWGCADGLNIHPNQNTVSLFFSREAFRALVGALQNPYEIYG